MKKLVCSLTMILLMCACASAPAPPHPEIPHEKGSVSLKPPITKSPVSDDQKTVSVPPPTEVPQQKTRSVTLAEEYHICRVFAARVLSKYSLVKNEVLNRYINLIGLTLTLHSDRPYTYGGYQFGAVQSNEINTYTCSGGTIFLTKGLIDLIENEDELAAVLAHEIAHVSSRDSFSHIRLPDIDPATEENTVKARDLLNTVSSSVFELVSDQGYEKEIEFSADRKAIAFLSSAGYDPRIFKDVLIKISARSRRDDTGMGKTHPFFEERLSMISQITENMAFDGEKREKRTRRFRSLLR